MTKDEAVLYMLKGVVSELPGAEQERFRECTSKLEAIIQEYGDIGQMALGVLGAKLASES